MPGKGKDGHVTFSGGQVTLFDPASADGSPSTPRHDGAATRTEALPAVSEELLAETAADRGAWGGKIEFMLTMVSYAVGLGNVWRFPYLCYRNGGGAFILPYIIMLVLVGLPLYYMEMAFGQFASLGPLTIWKVSPLFKGVGLSMLLVSSMVCIYYTVIIAWTIFYLFASMQYEVPWTSCVANESLVGNETVYEAVAWLRGRCLEKEVEECVSTNGSTNASVTAFITANVTANSTCETTELNVWGENNVSLAFDVKTPPEHYFFDRVLSISSGIDDIGDVQWELLLCLLLAWILIAAILVKGVEILGKISYLTAIYPYIMLTALIIKGATLEGSADGMIYLFKPQWEKLGEPRVWTEAIVQIFYSLSVCTGGLITMSSYNGFTNNCLRDAIIVAIINCATSMYAGCAIFCILGYMAHITKQDIADVAKGGPGLVFIVYPEGLATLTGANVWSVFFFFMMFLLGLGSSLTMVENVLSTLLDEYPVFRKTQLRNSLTRIGICFIFFLLGIPMIAYGGVYLLQIVDLSTGGFPMLVTALCEICIINWIYGYEQFAEDIELMLGKKPNWYWKITWKYVSGPIIIFVIVFSIIDFHEVTYADVYQYPHPFLVMGYLIQAFPILAIPYCALRHFCIKSGLWGQTKEMTHPEGDWGPAKRENRRGKYAEDDSKIEDDYEMEEEFRRQRAASKLSAAASAVSASAASDFDMAPTPPPQRAPIRAPVRAPVPQMYQNRTTIAATSPNPASVSNIYANSGSVNHGFDTDDKIVSRL